MVELQTQEAGKLGPMLTKDHVLGLVSGLGAHAG